MRKLGGLVVLLLGLAALAFSVRTALTSTASADRAGEASAPKRQLDNVRSRAHELEQQQQQQADDIAKRAAEQ